MFIIILFVYFCDNLLETIHQKLFYEQKFKQNGNLRIEKSWYFFFNYFKQSIKCCCFPCLLKCVKKSYFNFFFATFTLNFFLRNCCCFLGIHCWIYQLCLFASRINIYIQNYILYFTICFLFFFALPKLTINWYKLFDGPFF